MNLGASHAMNELTIALPPHMESNRDLRLTLNLSPYHESVADVVLSVFGPGRQIDIICYQSTLADGETVMFDSAWVMAALALARQAVNIPLSPQL